MMPQSSPEPNRPPLDEAPVARLLQQMRSGDREASAEFIRSYAPLIRRRIRWKLSPAMRRVFDSEEILSTLGRRIDLQLLHGKIDVRTEREFWALITTMLEHTISDKARHSTRSRKAEEQAVAIGKVTHADANQSDADDAIYQALQSLDNESDRSILGLWLRGATHAQTAAALDLSPQTVRKRWQRILDRFRRSDIRESA